MNWYESSLPDINEIKERLQVIIPENVDDANYARNITAARTVFVMLYSFAIEGESGRIRPSTVTVMTDKQSKKQSRLEREMWLSVMLGAKKPNDPERWYSENTREPIRDDTIATLKQLGAVCEVPGIPVTSSKPRYFLARDFVELLNPSLIGELLEVSVRKWQELHLAKGALILQSLREQERRSQIFVEFGHTKHPLASGMSSVLTKAAVEIFAKNFMEKPEVLLISESADKVHWKFGKLLQSLRLALNPKRALPDVIIAETGRKEFCLVFIEIVHTDGPISNDRKRELLEFAGESGLQEHECTFVTVFASRSDSAYRRVQGSLAWGSFVWFADEPERIIHLIDTPKQSLTLVDLLML
ncbi:BsuBI/PstI family type II restriction endonuclease [Paenibacillus sp. P22]|uniref:BsuBI/PstI family type II restriction endonuclease n=1 Tax=Paenibacillus sp. P22 TaxID=483908 RepID=UPI000403CE86|nr:BsuBI/PstI family type II restriction endonuclease [Paenibacillus sp. P22]CDN46162.1 BsuBIPstI restriction endonuclease domain protein [Paenibacillus sp. P22]